MINQRILMIGRKYFLKQKKLILLIELLELHYGALLK